MSLPIRALVRVLRSLETLGHVERCSCSGQDRNAQREPCTGGTDAPSYRARIQGGTALCGLHRSVIERRPADPCHLRSSRLGRCDRQHRTHRSPSIPFRQVVLCVHVWHRTHRQRCTGSGVGLLHVRGIELAKQHGTHGRLAVRRRLASDHSDAASTEPVAGSMYPGRPGRHYRFL